MYLKYWKNAVPTTIIYSYVKNLNQNNSVGFVIKRDLKGIFIIYINKSPHISKTRDQKSALFI